jgi:hypothetical protein
MTGNEPDRGVAISSGRRSSLDRWLLLIVLVAGGASVIFLKIYPVPLPIRIAVPIAIIIGYALLTALRSRFRLRYDQAGDNCYYMGFIFTLVSLSVALYSIQSTLTARVGLEIVRDFGLALSTTVVGIIARVVFNQLREDPHDIEEASRRELIEHSRALSGQLRASVGLMIDVREATVDRLQTITYETKQIVTEHHNRIDELKVATGTLVTQIKALADDLGSVEIPTGRLRTAAAETVEVVQALSATIRNVEADVKRIGPAASEAAAGYGRMTGASSAVVEQGSRLSASMADNAQKSAELSRGLESLSLDLHALGRDRDGVPAVVEQFKVLTEALRSATRSIGSSNSKLGVAEQSLATHLASAERAAANLASQLAALRSAHTEASGMAQAAPASQASE